MSRSTQPLKDALAEYDASQHDRDLAWASAMTGRAIERCIDSDVAAMRKVREAFYELTSDRNSLASAMLADLGFIRRIAAMDEIAETQKTP